MVLRAVGVSELKHELNGVFLTMSLVESRIVGDGLALLTCEVVRGASI